MKQQSVTRKPSRQAGERRVAGDLIVDPQRSLWELVVDAGLQVLQQLFEQDREALCGPRYRHRKDRTASRTGTTRSEVMLGGRRVAIRRPRVRAEGRELTLPTFQAVSDRDVLTRRAVEQMLVGVATRHYARSLEPVGGGVVTRGTSKSAVSRRFIAHTAAQLASWRTSSLAHLDLVALFIDGAVFADHCVVIALGVDASGRKHALGLWSGSTETAGVCQGLLANLRDRGLCLDRSLLVVIDGSRALRKAIRDVCGETAWVQRCQVHKLRNVLAHLPKVEHARVRARLMRAYHSVDMPEARRRLTAVIRQLADRHPAAAASLEEGLDETLTVLELPVIDRLRRSFATTNAIENVMSHLRYVHRNVKRWRDGRMVVRWAAAGLQEAAKGFRRIKGCGDLAALITALRARDRSLGLVRTEAA